eukprot:TRINITY_DN70012_c0_g1_i1.p1 TRINITY_DN70012_c0_g1~~TRINITY_DN70012_c0_g1_i1.p1  ORF type:complete len:572 (+),score=179.72 TRINITY_DN70012_c0_g1_i1:120-1835(+)
MQTNSASGVQVGLDLPLPGGHVVDASSLPSYSQPSLTDFQTSTLSLVALQAQTTVHNDLVPGPLPKSESFDALVREQLGKLEAVLQQLKPKEEIRSQADLRFVPGGILDALRALIEVKMEQLARQNESQGGSGEVCQRYVQGVCSLGATCDCSHTDAALRRWVSTWVADRAREGALTIAEPLGREALVYVYQQLEGTPQVHTLRANALERHSAKVVCKKVSANAAPHLTVLDMTHTGRPGTAPLGRTYPEGTAKLAAALAQNVTVEQVIVDNNDLGAKGFLTLLRAFDRPHGNSKVRVLSAKNNGIDGEEDPLRVEAAAAILKQAQGLEQLSLACNPLRAGGAAKLAPVIPGNPRICIFDLCATQIGDEGAKALADAIREAPAPAPQGPPGLLSLNVGWCRMGPDGLNALFDALGENPGNLEELAVYCNTATSKTGSARIGDLLKQNGVLTSLDLRWTYPSEDCASSLLEELSKSSHAIRNLDMGHNEIVTDKRVLELIAKKLPPTTAGAPSGASKLRQKRAELADHHARALERARELDEKRREGAVGTPLQSASPDGGGGSTGEPAPADP